MLQADGERARDNPAVRMIAELASTRPSLVAWLLQLLCSEGCVAASGGGRGIDDWTVGMRSGAVCACRCLGASLRQSAPA